MSTRLLIASTIFGTLSLSWFQVAVSSSFFAFALARTSLAFCWIACADARAAL